MTPTPLLRRASAALVCVGLWVAAGAASTSWAAPTPAELEKARATFRAGTALEAANDWGNALARFREVVAVKPSPQVLFHIGRCLEHLGKWTEALGQYRLAADMVEPGKKDVLKEIESARTALEARMPKLIIRRGIGADSVSISVDGLVLGAPLIGSELPLDPGAHLVVATEDGKERFSQKIAIHENESKSVTIDIQPASVAGSASVAPAAVPVEPVPSDKIAGSSGRRPLGFVVGGVGVASLVASGVFFYLRQQTISDLDKVCIDGHCPPDSKSTEDSGKLYQTVSQVTLGVGAAGVALGAVLILSGKSGGGARVSLATGAPGATSGLSVLGRF